MNKVDGLHHLAVCTGDMKGQVKFFTEVLGMELVALYWMHGVEGTFHGFLRMNDESSIALVHNPKIAGIAPQMGVSHAGNPGAASAPGTMQHLALRVKNHAELIAMRDRIRAHGVPVMGPIDHGFCESIYFAGPENLSLELSWSAGPIPAKAWIDPEVVDLCGISEAELAAFMAPGAYAGGAQAQPDLKGPGPHMTGYPPGAYEKIMSIPDEVITATRSETTPPVAV
jgi:catechol 2,3-dioxygenase-like lactoylglutathione lyase family enzyme